MTVKQRNKDKNVALYVCYIKFQAKCVAYVLVIKVTELNIIYHK